MQSDVLFDTRRLDAVAGLARDISAAYARMCELVAGCDPLEDQWLREEISCLLRISAHAAEQLIVTGRELARRLPLTRAALAGGAISYDHARRIATGLCELPDLVVAGVEAELVTAATEVTPGRLERRIEQAVLAAGPAAAQQAADLAARGRDVTIYRQPHGMASLVAFLPAAAAQEVMLALDAAADRRAPGDERSRGERRADTLHGWAARALGDGELPTRHGRPVTVQVTMSLRTALGLSDAPAELAGYGPIPAATARALAADGSWQALVTDAATGRVLDVGRRRYRPSQALRDLLLARYPTCTFPHCSRPATACDLDHRDPYRDGGGTDTANLAPMCRRHHRLKTHGGWKPKANPDGTTTWTSPQQRKYHNDPENRYPEPEPEPESGPPAA